MKKLLIGFVLMAASSVAPTSWAEEDPVTFDTASVEIKGVTLTVEYAQTWPQRAQGLMHRQTLCEECGMLFRFDYARKASMWMKNTFIPLDVAFIRADGTISDILPLQPHDLTSVGASSKVLYALEMNQGWFAEKGIVEGDKLNIMAP